MPITHTRLAVRFLTAPLLFTSGVILAQPVPDSNYNIGDALRDAQTPRTLPAPAQQQAAPVIEQADDAPMSMSDEQTVAIKDFRVEGVEVQVQDFLLREDIRAEIDAQLAPYRQRDLTMNEINQAANRMTVLARSKGYLVARAFVPKQAVQDQEGVLVIRLQVGQYGQFEMDNHSRVRDGLLQDIFERSKHSSPLVHRDTLERPMLLVHDLPGAQMPLVSIAAGQTPGTSDFLIKTDAGPRVQGYAMADNYGSRFTGKNRASLGVEVNSPFGIGDRLSASGMTSKAAGLQSGRLAYGLPLNANGLRGELAASRTTYKLGDEYADLDATGTATAVDVTLSWPLKRTREDSLYLSANVARKRLKDEYFNGATTLTKESDVLTLAARRETWGSLFGLGSSVNLNGSATVGRLKFKDAVQEAQNRAGANSVGNYAKLNASITLNLALAANWALSTSLQVQQALGKNLDGSEQISASGSGGIKAYPDGVSGDSGFITSAEVSYALPRLFNRIDHRVGLFADYGEVRPHNGNYANLHNVNISDVGLSYALGERVFFGRMQLARTTGSKAQTQRHNRQTKFHANFGLRF